jgi:hypothetical protein
MSVFRVLNPRGGRKRRRKNRRHARAHSSRKHNRRRRRANPFASRRHTRRRRRNPQLLGGRAFKLFGVDLGAAGLVFGGGLATGVIAQQASNMIPWAPIKTPAGRLATKAAVTFALAMFGGKMLGRRVGELVALGGGVAVLMDGYKMIQASVPMLPSVGDYNEALEDYVPEAGMSGVGDDYSEELGRYQLGAVTGRTATPLLAPWQRAA